MLNIMKKTPLLFCFYLLHPCTPARNKLNGKSEQAAPSTTPSSAAESEGRWELNFFDDFDEFMEDNWQDQMLWVNNEDQCYVPYGKHGTREVSNGTLKLRVIDLGKKVLAITWINSANKNLTRNMSQVESHLRTEKSLFKASGQRDLECLIVARTCFRLVVTRCL